MHNSWFQYPEMPLCNSFGYMHIFIYISFTRVLYELATWQYETSFMADPKCANLLLSTGHWRCSNGYRYRFLHFSISLSNLSYIRIFLVEVSNCSFLSSSSYAYSSYVSYSLHSSYSSDSSELPEFSYAASSSSFKGCTNRRFDTGYINLKRIWDGFFTVDICARSHVIYTRRTSSFATSAPASAMGKT